MKKCTDHRSRVVTARLAAMRAIHPGGVLPHGNALVVSPEDARARRDRRRLGLGKLAALDDATLLDVCDKLSRDLEGARALARLARASKACRAFATHEDVWKAATLTVHGGRFRWCSSGRWVDVFARTQRRGKKRGREEEEEEEEEEDKVGRGVVIQTPIFSDALHQRYMCAAMSLEDEWVDDAPSTVPEETAAALSVEEFRERYESVNLPVVIRGAANAWPAMTTWTRERLGRDFGETDFVVGGYDVALRDFFAMSDACRDDTPLYLFDPSFGEKAPALAREYNVPEYFAEDDYFKHMGEGRPHYRWLIVGPSRSGSIFHKDPNATSAWNAVVSGRKKWVMFPPDVIPPGVHPSEDGAEVAQPLSMVEWFASFYDFARDADAASRPLECVCEPGDVLFVPSGWWHMALNVTECIAVTQNFVSRHNARKVFAFLDTKCENLVSGTTRDRRGGLADAFVAAARASGDARLTAALDAHEAEKARKATSRDDHDAFADAASANFSFGFDVPRGA